MVEARPEVLRLRADGDRAALHPDDAGSAVARSVAGHDLASRRFTSERLDMSTVPAQGGDDRHTGCVTMSRCGSLGGDLSRSPRPPPQDSSLTASLGRPAGGRVLRLSLGPRKKAPDDHHGDAPPLPAVDRRLGLIDQVWAGCAVTCRAEPSPGPTPSGSPPDRTESEDEPRPGRAPLPRPRPWRHASPTNDAHHQAGTA
jgi:hypothetical protein